MGFSRVISMESWRIGLGVVQPKQPSYSGLTLSPMPRATRSIIGVKVPKRKGKK